jgi:hypothetical protein
MIKIIIHFLVFLRPELSHRAFVFALFFGSLFSTSQAALIQSSGSGNWTSGSTWVGGVVPGCGDSIVIMSGHSISISSNIPLNTCPAYIPITLSGTLVFSNGRKLQLPCGSRIYLFSGGLVTVTGGGASNTIEICGVTAWSRSSGNFSGPSCLPVTLPGCATVLPVKLRSFYSRLCGEKVCHTWVTATEKDSHSFCIEKSRDGLQFTQVGCLNSLAPGGSSQTDISYSYEEDVVDRGTNYYRLKQINTDGSAEFSAMTALEFLPIENIGFRILPNPNQGQVRILLDKALPYFQILIYDYTGKIYASYLAENSSDLNIKIEQKGMYLCQVLSSEIQSTGRIIVE